MINVLFGAEQTLLVSTKPSRRSMQGFPCHQAVYGVCNIRFAVGLCNHDCIFDQRSLINIDTASGENNANIWR